jgi:eukaryotic-like serine/threonine-protein kinase
MATAKKTSQDTLKESSQSGTRSAAQDRDLSGSAGQTIAERYLLDELLGRGGMGEVWRARHVVTQRPVALKLLRRTLAYNPDMRRRFLREARAAAAIDHPNVVQVLDAFEAEDGSLALVMPLLEGETLKSMLAREGPLDLDSTLRIVLPMMSAVATAHRLGIVHRDLKPDNVFLALEHGEPVVKVLDFGVAKLVEADVIQGTLTGTGAVLGTPGYMAPEQALADHDQDHGVDIWALGVITYEALSGCKPVEGENTAQLMRSLLTQAITPLEVLVAGLPEPVTQMVMRMLQRDRVNRPQDLNEVIEALRIYLPGYSSPRVSLPVKSSGRRPLQSGGRRSDPPPLELAETASINPPRITTSRGTTLVSASDKPEAQSPPSSRRSVAPKVAAGLAIVASAYWWLSPSRSEQERPSPRCHRRALQNLLPRRPRRTPSPNLRRPRKLRR